MKACGNETEAHAFPCLTTELNVALNHIARKLQIGYFRVSMKAVSPMQCRLPWENKFNPVFASTIIWTCSFQTKTETKQQQQKTNKPKPHESNNPKKKKKWGGISTSRVTALLFCTLSIAWKLVKSRNRNQGCKEELCTGGLFFRRASEGRGKMLSLSLALSGLSECICILEGSLCKLLFVECVCPVPLQHCTVTEPYEKWQPGDRKALALQWGWVHVASNTSARERSKREQAVSSWWEKLAKTEAYFC